MILTYPVFGIYINVQYSEESNVSAREVGTRAQECRLKR